MIPPTKHWSFIKKRRGVQQDRVPWDGLAMGNAPCTPLGCVELIDRAGVELSGANVVVVGSNIVGLPVATMLTSKCYSNVLPLTHKFTGSQTSRYCYCCHWATRILS